MTAEQKTAFIKDIMFNMEMKFKSAVDKMPAEWDGKQLRHYMSDRFLAEVSTLKMNRQEKVEYEHACANLML